MFAPIGTEENVYGAEPLFVNHEKNPPISEQWINSPYLAREAQGMLFSMVSSTAAFLVLLLQDIGAINPLFTGWIIFMVYKKLKASWDQVH